MNSLIKYAAFVAAILSALSNAKAGDFAEFQSLGFSKDGSVYAFEQFGIQDGSGFPYSERFFIDVKTDSFIKGTPIKLRIEDETASLMDVRNTVREKSQPFMEAHGIGVLPGRIAAFNPSTEISSEPYELSFHSFAYEPNPRPPHELMLQTFSTPATHHCADFMDEVAGFVLSLKATGKSDFAEIYKDKSIPKSRNCPIDYRLGGVVTTNDFSTQNVHIFLVLVKSMGFEGPDGNWIAIPKILD